MEVARKTTEGNYVCLTFRDWPNRNMIRTSLVFCMADQTESSHCRAIQTEESVALSIIGSGDEGRHEAHVDAVLQRAIRNGGTLDRQLRTSLFAFGMANTETVSVLFTSKPVSAALTKWPARFGLLLFSLASLVGAWHFLGNSPFKFHTGPYFRVVGDEFRGGKSSLNGTNMSVSRFGVLHDRRRLEASNVIVLDSSTLEGSFDDEQTANGFFFLTASGTDPNTDPIRVTLYASSDRITWERHLSGSRSCVIDVPMQRQERVDVSWAGHEKRTMIIGPTMIVASLLNLAAFALAVAGNVLGSKISLVGALSLTEVALITSTSFGLCANNWFGAAESNDATAFLMAAALFGIICATWLERCIIWACAFFGISCIAVGAIEKNFGNDPNSVFWPVLIGSGASLLVFALSSWLLRLRILNRARRIMRADLAAYQSVWSQMCEDEHCKRDLDALAALASRMQPKTPEKRLRQCCEGGSFRDWTTLETETFERISVASSSRHSGVREIQVGGGHACACAASEIHEEGHDLEAGGGGQQRPGAKGGGRLGGESQDESDAGWTSRGSGLLDGGTLRPMESLDQLYLTAACLSPILRKKVQAWACAGGGGFPWREVQAGAVPLQEGERGGEGTDLEEGGGGGGGGGSTEEGQDVRVEVVRAEEEKEAGGAECQTETAGAEERGSASARRKEVGWWRAGMSEDLFQWGRLKHPDRAIQKAVRVYGGGDVGRLLDICRECIVCRDVAGIRHCLEAIQNDPDIVVERIKNRFDPAYDAVKSCGYRDVALNLRIVSRRTKELAIHTHICEVQLLLLDYFNLKSVEGHKNYVAFRNLRGE